MRLQGTKAEKLKFLLSCGIQPVKGKEIIVFEAINEKVKQMCLRDLEENHFSMIDFFGQNAARIHRIGEIVSNYYMFRSTVPFFQELNLQFVKDNKEIMIQGLEEYIDSGLNLTEDEIYEAIIIGFYEFVKEEYLRRRHNGDIESRQRMFSLLSVFYKFSNSGVFNQSGYVRRHIISYKKHLNYFFKLKEVGISKELCSSTFDRFLSIARENIQADNDRGMSCSVFIINKDENLQLFKQAIL